MKIQFFTEHPQPRKFLAMLMICVLTTQAADAQMFVITNQTFGSVDGTVGVANTINHQTKDEPRMVITLPITNPVVNTGGGGRGGSGSPTILVNTEDITSTTPDNTAVDIDDRSDLPVFNSAPKPKKTTITLPVKDPVLPTLPSAPKESLQKITQQKTVQPVYIPTQRTTPEEKEAVVYEIVAPLYTPILRRPTNVQQRPTLTITQRQSGLYPKAHTTHSDAWQLNSPLIILLLIFLMLEIIRNRKETTQHKVVRGTLYALIIVLLSVFASAQAHAATLTNTKNAYYAGYLQDTNANPIVGNYTFRFSLWDTLSFQPAGTDIAGGHPDYLNVTETRTITLTDGNFEFNLDFLNTDTQALIQQGYIYVQVEIKESSQPDTNYFLVDVNPDDVTIDRLLFKFPPYAQNAETLDFKNTGYGADEIPYVDMSGFLPSSIIPNELVQDQFTIGVGNAVDDIILNFGQTPGASITWSPTTNDFTFSNDVRITGKLIVDNTINNITIGERESKHVISPMYPNSVFDADGTNNIGSMFEEAITRAGALENSIRWSSDQTTLQDYQIIIRHTLTDDFISFDTVNPQISLDFETEGTIADAVLHLTIQKDGSIADELLATGQNLQNNTWGTQTFGLNPATTWTAGDTMIFVLDMYAKDQNAVRVGDISINRMKQ